MLITDVRAGSAAAEAGLRKWDVIRQINRRPIRSVEEYEELLAEVKPGDEVGLVIRRETRRYYRDYYAVLKVPE